PKTISTTAHRIFHQVHAHTLHGRLALTLGGCHTSTIGTLTATTAALQQTQNQRHQHSPPIHSTTTPAVIILDAHLALNTPSTSPSGNLNGMPLAYATGVAGAATTDSTPDAPFSWIQQAWRVDFRRLVYIGTRDVDPPERDVVARHAIKVFGMEEVRRHGIEKIMDAVFAYLGPETPIHLSVNVDALDPRWAPGTGNPVEGGLSLEDGKCVARRVRDSGNLVAVDVVEVDPTVTDREGVERTVRAAAWLVRCALTEC
ncbi:Arginase/deacetylase, partial [Aspergillus homomorphus CBS 101889]